MRQARLQGLIVGIFFCLALGARGDVTLAWNPSPDANITNYTVYWGTNSGVYVFDQPVGMQSTLTVTGLLPNTPYYFSVQATASDGTETPFSNEIAYTNNTATPPTPSLPGSGGSTVTGGGSSGGSSGGTSNLPVYVGTGTSGGSGGSSGNGSMSEFSVAGVPPVLTLSLSNNLPTLNISATVGATLSIQSSTNPMNPDTWATIADLPITNAVTSNAANTGAPSTISLAFVPGMQTYQVVDTNPPPGEYYRAVMPYDYMVLADSVLSAQGDPSRLIMISMPGVNAADVCYVTPQSSFLYFDALNSAFALNPSGATIRQIAASLSSSLGQNWTSASEFAYSNGVSSILATVVETEPASSDPVAGASTPIITIDF